MQEGPLWTSGLNWTVSLTVLSYSVLYSANNQLYLATEFIKLLSHLLTNF